MKRIRILSGVALAIGLSCNALAATPLQSGISKYFLQDFAGAEISLSQSADAGVSDASYYLGLIYRDQYNDAYSAFNHFEAAAKRDHTISQIELGIMYAEGLAPVSSDPEQAKYWFRNAQLKDRSGAAAYWLHTFETDPGRIVALLADASELGHADATRKLGNAYLNGSFGLQINRNKGNELLQLAVAYAE